MLMKQKTRWLCNILYSINFSTTETEFSVLPCSALERDAWGLASLGSVSPAQFLQTDCHWSQQHDCAYVVPQNRGCGLSSAAGALVADSRPGTWHPEVLRCCPKTGAQVLSPCATGAKNVSVLKVCNFRAVSLVSVNRLPVVVLRDEAWIYQG